ncbi:pimeloyl-ACP methyl ester esterase BioH [Alteromonas gilva]|uniref:Pimeloyl-[acyl-carrier protein] methyl ester esterase n=1 Tax=Alteromonas gilva TaxID=2987522 RepID=A0ABT5L0A0_9ALTE|nr:pimeloyl-ACP methyl ester esterase BioH [Alteromonas gilva]MDC8829312.1 pimeloyl-ACP methyl ester esterase BioH [Alteromonas gilva]
MLDDNTIAPLNSLTEGTGKALVLLHGWGMNSAVFTEFLPLLTAELRVIRICLPGFGQNAVSVPDNYSLATLTDWVASVIPDGAVVAGWSLGGLVAQQLALDYANKVAGVITLASSPCFVSGPGWRGIEPQVLQGFQTQLARNYEKTLDRFLAIQAMGSPSAKQDVKVIRGHLRDLPAPAEQALVAGLNLLEQTDLRQAIGRITQPTLRLYGRLDSLVPTCSIDRIHELQPAADTVVLSRAAHAPFISHPQQTAEIMLSFVKNLDKIDRRCS